MDCIDFGMDKTDIPGMRSTPTAPFSRGSTAVPSLVMSGGMLRTAHEFRAHAHTHWEVVLYTEGTGTLTVDGRAIAFRPGTVVCTPPGAVHSEVSAGGFRNMWVALGDLHAEAEVPVLQLYPEHPMFALVPIIQVEHRLKRPVSALILRNLFSVFMMYLDEHLKHDPHERLIARLARIITGNLENPSFRVQDALAELPLSADHLRRLFAERMGMSPVRYLIDLRMARARELLLMGFSVKETADRVGLADQYYLSRLFRRTQGVSPSAFQRAAGPRRGVD